MSPTSWNPNLPLQLRISIQLISDLLQTLRKTFMAGVTQLNATQLTPGYFSVTITITITASIATNPFIDEAAGQGRDDRGNERKQRTWEIRSGEKMILTY